MPEKGINCPVCAELCHRTEDASGHAVECPRCGRFRVSDVAFPLLDRMSWQQKVCISGWISENQSAHLDANSVVQLGRLRMPSVGEKANKILFFLSKCSRKAGRNFLISNESGIDPHDGEDHVTLPLKRMTGIAWAADMQELDYLLNEYLQGEVEHLKYEYAYHIITPKGWAYLDSINQANTASNTVFVAMWFDKSVDPASVAIEAGIRNSGYEPLRIDRKEHNNKIDDEIVVGIRRSKFLVADFTGHRGGVYFETGFATGLGLPVIWLCRQDELEKTHFDTRQYNFIVWEVDKLAELSKALQNRIEATIGRGPLTANVMT